MKKQNDEPLSQVAVQYNRDITGKKETNEQYLEKIENKEIINDESCQFPNKK